MSQEILTLDSIQKSKRLLEIQEELLMQQSLTGNDPDAILKAMKHIEEIKKEKNEGQIKSFLYAPENEMLGAWGHRTPMKIVSFRTLRHMARTPIIKTIINTRVDQVARFSEPSENEQEKGWMIRKKRGYGKEDKETVKEITKSVVEGGLGISAWEFDSFDQILRMITRDSLEVDQICMEIVGDKRGRPVEFLPVDAATIRLTDAESAIQPLPRQVINGR